MEHKDSKEIKGGKARKAHKDSKVFKDLRTHMDAAFITFQHIRDGIRPLEL
jgi:hypothetical protein